MVRVWSPGKYVARPEWYDRNPIDRVLTYQQGGIAPHGVTTRATYTCPAGKKAFLEAIYLLAYRQTAATTVGVVSAYAVYTPSGGGDSYFGFVCFTNNAVDYHEDFGLGNCGVLRAGDALALRTMDLSTAGTLAYYLMIKITEFDA